MQHSNQAEQIRHVVLAHKDRQENEKRVAVVE